MSLYDDLGVSKTASSDEIKAAYRRKAMQHHPDRGGDEAIFKKVKAAYETLSDAKSRKVYDSAASSSFSSFDAEDIVRRSTGSSFKNSTYDEDLDAKYRYYSDKSSSIFSVDVPVDISLAFKGGYTWTVLPNAYGGDGERVKIEIPAGVQPNEIVHDEKINGKFYRFRANITSSDKRFDLTSFSTTKGIVYTDLEVSPFVMITGGFVSLDIFDGATVQVRIPEAFQPNKYLKVKEHGYWVSRDCKARGDLIIQVIPIIKKASEYTLSEVSDFLAAVNRHNAAA